MTDSKKKAPLLPAYLVVGEDALKRATVIERLRKRLAEHGDLAFNSDVFEGETAHGGDIVTACNTMPFASDLRLVLVRDADKLKKADAEELVGYLKAPSEQTVLALEAEKLAKNTRLYKAVAAVGAHAVVDCAPPKSYELSKMVRAMATGHGCTFTEGAASRLVELVGDNTVHLDNEIKKIALAHRGIDPVTENEVLSLVSRTAEVKPWDFVDALAARDLCKCMACWARMESTSPHALIAMCTTRIRELVCARAMIERGNPRAIAKALSAYTGRSVPDWRVKNHATWARRFTREELRDALISARDAERAMKSGADAEEALLRWVISVCTPAKEAHHVAR